MNDQLAAMRRDLRAAFPPSLRTHVGFFENGKIGVGVQHSKWCCGEWIRSPDELPDAIAKLKAKVARRSTSA